jgi:dTDP-4-dehydrorhamnose reductase
VRLLLTGGGGQLGRALLASAPASIEVVAPRSADLDLTREGDAERWIAQARPTLVINAAAYTQVDRAEDEPEAAFAINERGPAVLAQAAAAAGARVIHVSTDFVFDGRGTVPYPVDSPTAPLGVYGASKRAGELAVLGATGDRAVVLRTAWLYDAAGRNFFTTMLRLFRERGTVGVVSDQTGTPTAASSLAAAIWRIAAREGVAGIHHWTDAGETTWYDFAVAIERLARSAGLLASPVTVRAITTAEYPTRACRPAYSVLDKDATSHALGLAPVDWLAVLESVVAERAMLEAGPTWPRSVPG